MHKFVHLLSLSFGLPKIFQAKNQNVALGCPMDNLKIFLKIRPASEVFTGQELYPGDLGQFTFGGP